MTGTRSSRSPAPVDEAAQRELRWIVTDALRSLPEATRTVLVLFYYDGLTVREIAAELGVTVAAVKSRLHKGRRQLARLLAAEYPELTRAAARGERTHAMTELHITKVVTFPARVLAVLSDEPGQRALPVWLSPLEGLPRWPPIGVGRRPARPAVVVGTRGQGPHRRGRCGTARVRIGELEDGRLFGTLVISGPTGDAEVVAGLGDALGLARLQDCPIVATRTCWPGTGSPCRLARRPRTCSSSSRAPAQARNDAVRAQRRSAEPTVRGRAGALVPARQLPDPTAAASTGRTTPAAPARDLTPPGRAATSRPRFPRPTGSADLRQGILADAYPRRSRPVVGRSQDRRADHQGWTLPARHRPGPLQAAGGP